jgi:hypothetical protein
MCRQRTEFIDSDPPTTSSVAYRVAAYSGVSSSHTASGTLTLASLFFGTPETFDVMTWNLEDFPRMNGSTISVVSQALKAQNPDFVGLQEMVSRAGFEDLLDSLWHTGRASAPTAPLMTSTLALFTIQQRSQSTGL